MKKIKLTKKQLDIIKLYWKMFQAEYDIFWGKLGELEKGMSQKTGIKDLEFFNSDSDWCGVGNGDRTMRLIQRGELEK